VRRNTPVPVANVSDDEGGDDDDKDDDDEDEDETFGVR